MALNSTKSTLFAPQVESWGDIMFGITYLSSAERLTVVVTKARNLKPVDEIKTHSASKYLIGSSSIAAQGIIDCLNSTLSHESCRSPRVNKLKN